MARCYLEISVVGSIICCIYKASFLAFLAGHLTSLEGFSFLSVLSDCIIQMQTSKALWKAKGENGAE